MSVDGPEMSNRGRDTGLASPIDSGGILWPAFNRGVARPAGEPISRPPRTYLWICMTHALAAKRTPPRMGVVRAVVSPTRSSSADVAWTAIPRRSSRL